MSCEDLTVTEEESDEESALGRRRGRSPRLVIAAVVIALVASALGALWLRSGQGDLPRQVPRTYHLIGAFPRGQTDFQVGAMYIKEKGKDIEILEVKALTSANVVQLGAIAAWPRDLGATESNPGDSHGFPDPSIKRYHPAFGIVIPKSEVDYIAPEDPDFGSRAIVVAAGFRLVSGDVGAINGLLLRYRVGGKTKTRYFPDAAFICVKPNPCGLGEDENGEDPFDEFTEGTLVELGLVPKDAYN